MVLQADDRQFGLVVDEINDTEEIVVKPLGKQLKGIACFAGATIMGDGRVALILDVLGLAQMANVMTEVHDCAGSEKESAVQHDGSRQSWLLFRSGAEQPPRIAAFRGCAAGGISRSTSSSTPATTRWCSIASRSCP